MSISPFFFIEYFDHKTGAWEKLDIFVRDKFGKFTAVEVWPWNGTHELFAILKNESDPYFEAVHSGLPINCSDEVQREFEACCFEVNEFSSYVPEVRWFNLADAELYIMKNPKVLDYNETDDIGDEALKVYMENPVKSLINRVIQFTDVHDEFWRCFMSESDFRVIFWLER